MNIDNIPWFIMVFSIIGVFATMLGLLMVTFKWSFRRAEARDAQRAWRNRVDLRLDQAERRFKSFERWSNEHMKIFEHPINFRATDRSDDSD